MSTILRSSKYLRYFASIGRNLVLNSGRGEIHETVIPQKQCLKCELPKYVSKGVLLYATIQTKNLSITRLVKIVMEKRKLIMFLTFIISCTIKTFY